MSFNFFKKKFTPVFVLTAVILSSFFVQKVFAVSTPNYVMDPLNYSDSNLQQSGSPSYNIFNQQVGDPAAGPGATANYDLRHGHLYPEVLADVFLDFTYVPEGRYGAPSTNDQTEVIIEVRPVGGNENTILFSQEVTTNADGTYVGLSLLGISAGTYDVTAKGWANLRIKKSSVVLISGTNSIDFTDAGVNMSKAGDINTYVRTTVPFQTVEIGDNMVGAADYSALVSNYLVPNNRFDLDAYDGNAGAADYSRLVGNYGLQGDL